MFTALSKRPSIHWYKSGACRTENASLISIFYSFKKAEIARAKAICHGCSIKLDCYNRALRAKEPAGIWGGVRFTENGPVIEPVPEPATEPRSPYYVSVPVRIRRREIRDARFS